MHWNPGQLGYLEQGHFDFGLAIMGGVVSYQRQRRGAYQYADGFEVAEPIAPASIDPSRTGPTKKVRATPVGPSFDLFVAVPVIPKRLTLGAGIYVPYAAILNLPRQGPQRFAVQSLSLVSTHTTLSAGVRLHDVISVGGGVTYALSFLNLDKVQDFGGISQLGAALGTPPIDQANDFGLDAPSTVRELDVLARQVSVKDGVSHSVSFNVGVALRPTERLDLAVVYQHGSKLRFKGDFTLDMSDDFFTTDLVSQGLEYPEVVRGDAEVELRLPKRITVGAGYQLTPRVRLDGWATYAFYQDFDRIDVKLSSPDLAQPELGVPASVDEPLTRRWLGSVLVELAPRIEVDEHWTVNTLLGYHSFASPDATVDMASPDGHRIIFGAGIAYTFGPRFSLLGDFEGQAMLPREVVSSDYDLANGTYNMFLGMFAVHGQLRFGVGKGRASPKAEPRPKTERAGP